MFGKSWEMSRLGVDLENKKQKFSRKLDGKLSKSMEKVVVTFKGGVGVISEYSFH